MQQWKSCRHFVQKVRNKESWSQATRLYLVVVTQATARARADSDEGVQQSHQSIAAPVCYKNSRRYFGMQAWVNMPRVAESATKLLNFVSKSINHIRELF